MHETNLLCTTDFSLHYSKMTNIAKLFITPKMEQCCMRLKNQNDRTKSLIMGIWVKRVYQEIFRKIWVYHGKGFQNPKCNTEMEQSVLMKMLLSETPSEQCDPVSRNPNSIFGCVVLTLTPLGCLSRSFCLRRDYSN